jgi:hypothetical protein
MLKWGVFEPPGNTAVEHHSLYFEFDISISFNYKPYIHTELCKTYFDATHTI